MRLLFRLALAFGCPVAELRQRLTMDEWNYWRAFWTLDPWGEQREDERAAYVIAAALAPHSRRAPMPSKFRLYPDERFMNREDKWDVILGNAERRALAHGDE